MINDSFCFNACGKKYIYRKPGIGTDIILNRKVEYAVYQAIKPFKISDEVLFFDPDTGHKLAVYMENSRTADSNNPLEVEKCMRALKNFHKLGLQVDYTFDLLYTLNLYENLWIDKSYYFDDYKLVKSQVTELIDYIDTCDKEWTLCHIDTLQLNILFVGEDVKLIDWEFAGMQDAHIDLATFCLFAEYNEEQVDSLIDTYFERVCEPEIRRKIYAYISICGFLWASLSEYQITLGIDLRDYSNSMYGYAKKYYKEWRKYYE